MVHNSLTSETRVDVNGVAVDKHGLPISGDAKYCASLEEAAQNPVLHFLKAKFHVTITRSGLSDEERKDLMGSLHPDTLVRLAEVVGTEFAMFARATASCIKSGNFAVLNNMGALAHMADEKHVGEFNYYVVGLHWHAEREAQTIDYGGAGEEGLIVPRALLRAVFELENNPGYMYVDTFRRARVPHTRIISLPLTELIEKRPHDVDRIISLLKERSLMVDFAEDIDHLEALLDSDVTGSLRVGVL